MPQAVEMSEKGLLSAFPFEGNGNRFLPSRQRQIHLELLCGFPFEGNRNFSNDSLDKWLDRCCCYVVSRLKGIETVSQD